MRKKAVTIYLTEEEHRFLKMEAALQRAKIGELVAFAVKWYLTNRAEERKKAYKRECISSDLLPDDICPDDEQSI